MRISSTIASNLKGASVNLFHENAGNSMEVHPLITREVAVDNNGAYAHQLVNY